jgi:hypothetical protein
MSLAIRKTDFFKQDYAIRFAWYVDEAGQAVARRFQVTLDQSLNKLASHPDFDHFPSTGRSTKFLFSITPAATCCTQSA